jgi:riboflavin synthase
MSNLIVVLTEDGYPCYSAKTSVNNELLVKAAQKLMEESGCRNAYIMGQVGPEGPCQTTVYKVKAKLVYNGQLNSKPHVVEEVEVDLETFKMMP